MHTRLRRWRVATGSLRSPFVVGAFQALFAKDIGSSSEVHALHGLLALAVFALAWSTLVRTRAEVRTVGAA
jgi:hypothetical protein